MIPTRFDFKRTASIERARTRARIRLVSIDIMPPCVATVLFKKKIRIRIISKKERMKERKKERKRMCSQLQTAAVHIEYKIVQRRYLNGP